MITWGNPRNNPVYILTADLERGSQCEMRLHIRNTQQDVYLHTTTLHFGGVRWWFRCPRCGRQSAKLYLPRHGSVFLCRVCHDLTYESCIEGRSVTAFMAASAGWFGLSVAEQKREIREDAKARNPWRRKRDRRSGYKGRGRTLQGESLKFKMLEAKAAHDMAKALGGLGNLGVDGY
jgi:hypothetical protein